MDNSVDLAVKEYEQTIMQIKGVVSGRIVPDGAGGIAEIHVLANSDRGPKQIVRDIESALMAKFNVSVDHKKISVAQMQEEEETRTGEEARPTVSGITVSLQGRTMEASVQLKIGGESLKGVGSGPSTASNRLRLVSQATVNAINEYLKGTCHIVIEDVKTFNLAGLPAVAVSVSLITNVGDELLIGAAFVKNDEKEAAVKATLAAVNRRFSLLLCD